MQCSAYRAGLLIGVCSTAFSAIPLPPDDDVFGTSFSLERSTFVRAISSSSLDRLPRLDLNECAVAMVMTRSTNVGAVICGLF